MFAVTRMCSGIAFHKVGPKQDNERRPEVFQRSRHASPVTMARGNFG